MILNSNYYLKMKQKLCLKLLKSYHKDLTNKSHDLKYYEWGDIVYEDVNIISKTIQIIERRASQFR